MVPFCRRPSRCFVLILSPAPSPWDASHSGYCKHKRLTVMIMAIIRYEFTIQHFLSFSKCKKEKESGTTGTNFYTFWQLSLHAGTTQFKDWKLSDALWKNLLEPHKFFLPHGFHHLEGPQLPRYPSNASHTIYCNYKRFSDSSNGRFL